MKRIWIWLLAAGALAMTGLWPMESCDVAELQPARVLMITMENGRIAADCGEASGSGATLDEALREKKTGCWHPARSWRSAVIIPVTASGTILPLTMATLI